MDITRDTPFPQGLSAVVYCDGSCPSNPGPMGIGFYIDIMPSAFEAGYRIEFGYRLGLGTNNKAEYLALIAALREALRSGVTHVEVFSDSMLTVNQVNGKWSVKESSLKNLHEEAQGLSRMFISFKLSHIDREDNTRADHLSKNPTDPTLPPPVIEIDITRKVRRKLSRQQAAMIRWWWQTKRCRNEYRLGRIFGLTHSLLGRIGRGEKYPDITEADLPRMTAPRTEADPRVAKSVWSNPMDPYED